MATAPATIAGISHQSLSRPSFTLLLLGILISRGLRAEVSFVISALRAVMGKYPAGTTDSSIHTAPRGMPRITTSPLLSTIRTVSLPSLSKMYLPSACFVNVSVEKPRPSLTLMLNSAPVSGLFVSASSFMSFMPVGQLFMVRLSGLLMPCAEVNSKEMLSSAM